MARWCLTFAGTREKPSTLIVNKDDDKSSEFAARWELFPVQPGSVGSTTRLSQAAAVARIVIATKLALERSHCSLMTRVSTGH